MAVLDKARGCEGQDFRDPRPGGPHQVQDEPVDGVFFGGEQPQHLGLEQIDWHLFHGLQDQGVLGDEPIPVEAHSLDGEAFIDRIGQAKEPPWSLGAVHPIRAVAHRFLHLYP